MAALSTFKRGHIWRVGTGDSINIWDDHWVPSSPSRMVISLKGHSLLRTVNELINPYTHQWDEQILRENFNPLDVERILKIPLSEHMDNDFVAWHLSKSYSFTVRSAYYAQWAHTFGQRTNGANGGSTAEGNPV